MEVYHFSVSSVVLGVEATFRVKRQGVGIEELPRTPWATDSCCPSTAGGVALLWGVGPLRELSPAVPVVQGPGAASRVLRRARGAAPRRGPSGAVVGGAP